MKRLAVVTMMVLATTMVAEAKTFGVFWDRRTRNITGMTNSLVKAGWNVKVINMAQMEDPELLKTFDVLAIVGGHNGYFFPSTKARHAIVREAARGMGVLSAGFRNGYVRSASRPIFPMFGMVYNRLNSPWMEPEPNTPFTEAFGSAPIAFSGHDHLVMTQNTAGKVFARSGKDITGTYGEFAFGKVVVFGGHFLYNPGDAGEPACERILLAFADWLKRSNKPSEAEANKAADLAEAELIRGDVIYTWCNDDRGPDRSAGVYPFIRDRLTVEPDALRYKLEYYAKFLSEKDAKKCLDVAGKIAKSTDALRARVEADYNALNERLKKASATEVKTVGDKLMNEVIAKLRKVAKGEGETPEEVALVKTLKEKLHGDDRNRSYASYALGNVSPRNLAAVEALVETMASKDEGNSTQAKISLGLLCATEEYRPLLDWAAVAEAKKLIAEMKPKVRKAKDDAIEAENKADMKLVPGYVKDLESADRKVRLNAALEIGRISPNDKSAVKALIKALEDEDEPVRTQAAISLGWMRAKDAVKPLLKRLDSKCVWDRRRAVQALGNIGDQGVIDRVLEVYEKDPDRDTRMLALMDLGWLKAAKAVPMLLSMATNTQTQIDYRCAAIQALGYIGDKSVLPIFEATIKKTGRDTGRRGALRNNDYSIDDRHGLYVHLRQAIENLNKGGKHDLGVVQDPDARSRDVFYALTKKCNAYAGRTDDGLGHNFEGGRGKRLLMPYLVDAGFTGINNGWGWSNMDSGEMRELLDEVDDMGLYWIDVLPGYGWIVKPDGEAVLDKVGHLTAWQGFWSEECWPDIEGTTSEELDKFLKRRFGDDYKKTQKLTQEEIALLDPKTGHKEWTSYDDSNHIRKNKSGYEMNRDGFLHTEPLEYFAEQLRDNWKESQDFLHARRKACAHTYVISTADPVRYIGGNAAFKQIDTLGPECYQCFGRASAFLIQKYRDGEARPTMAEFYHWYCPSNAHALRGYWQNAIHGKCFYNFALHQIFAHATGQYLWTWEKGRWDGAKTVFRRVRDNEEWYSVAPTKVNVAVMSSERSASGVKEQVYFQVSYLIRKEENALATWTSLNQSHLPADVIYAEGINAEKLVKYDVICLTDAKMLSNEECEVLKAWVKEGGTLIAEGTTSLFDPYRPKVVLKNYRLADLFGADYKNSVFEKDNDTLAWRPGSPTSFPVKLGFDEPWHFEDWVHRDVKPTKGVVTAKFEDGSTVEYDLALGYDQVKATTAKVIAKFENGDPAVLENAYGKGRCYFQTSHFPRLGFVCSEWEMMPSRFDFWPGVKESLEKMVRAGIAAKGSAEAVSFDELSPDVEVTPEDRGDFMTVHLLDYDVAEKTIKGPLMTVNGARKVKRAFYPDTKTEAAFTDNKVQLRDFKVYDLVVIEFEK